MSIDAMPDRRLPYAWHIRGVPSTHLGPMHRGGPFDGDMPTRDSTLCAKRGGPQWVPGPNPGTMHWCPECVKAWDTVDRVLAREAEKIRYEDYLDDIPRET
jgi:hypothetical protein